jgi:heptosyltransferase-2
LSTTWQERASEDKQPGCVAFAARVPNWLGDAVLAVPAVRALVDCSRRGRVLVLASTSSAEVFSRVQGTLVFAVKTPGANVLGWIKAIQDGSALLRRFRPVMVFSMTKSFTSAATCFGGGVPRRVGMANGPWRFFYTDRIARGDSDREHLADTYCRLVESVGIGVADRVSKVSPTPADLEAGARLLRRRGLARGSFVCFFPGARYGPAKRWDPARFALLGDAVIAKLGFAVVILGGREDLVACRAVETQMNGKSLNLCGDIDFSSLVGTLHLSGGVVANDSGGMHLAAALGVPVVGLFFSTRPDWTRPRAPWAEALYNKAECSPCFQRDCRRGNMCTETIGVDEVLAALCRVREEGP